MIDVAVFGIPDDEWGEQRPRGRPTEGRRQTSTSTSCATFVEARLARYKRPREYELRAELPRTEAGKLLKRVLRDEYWRDRESAV